MVGVSLKDLWKSSNINGLQASSKVFILILIGSTDSKYLNFFRASNQASRMHFNIQPIFSIVPLAYAHYLYIVP